MHDFCYVSKREAAPIKAELIDLNIGCKIMLGTTSLFNIILWVVRAVT